MNTRIKVTLIILTVLGLYIIFTGFAELVGLKYWVININPNNSYLENLRNIGGYYSGTIGILVSILTVVLVYETFRRQQIEGINNRIQNQRREFENHFYQLLKVFENIISRLTVRLTERGQSPNILQGREVMEHLYVSKLAHFINYDNAMENKIYYDENNIEEYINKEYQRFHDDNQDKMGHYFRTLYNIFKLIKENEELIRDKKDFYVKIVKGQLSSYEILLLFYNCIWEVGRKHFKQYVIDFHLLEHIDKKKIHKIRKDEDVETEYNLYPASAYED